MSRRPVLLALASALALGLTSPSAEAGGPRYCYPHGPHGKIKCKKVKFEKFKEPKFEHGWKAKKFKWKD